MTKVVEVVSVSGSTAYIPLDYVRSNADGIWVRNNEGDVEPAYKSIDLYLPNKDISVEEKESWKEGEDSPYESLKP